MEVDTVGQRSPVAKGEGQRLGDMLVKATKSQRWKKLNILTVEQVNYIIVNNISPCSFIYCFLL